MYVKIIWKRNTRVDCLLKIFKEKWHLKFDNLYFLLEAERGATIGSNGRQLQIIMLTWLGLG